MPLGEGSKRLSRSDDAAKNFVRASLAGSVTRGFDIDSLYCEVHDGKITWTVFEFLKCDTVSPESSHPMRYWNRSTANRKKFLSLWAVLQALHDPHRNMDARLLLVNYRDSVSSVKVLTVVDVNEQRIVTKDEIMSYSEWRRRYKNFNDTKRGATWDALPLLAGQEGED